MLGTAKRYGFQGASCRRPPGNWDRSGRHQ
jgi:hypothetical protein